MILKLTAEQREALEQSDGPLAIEDGETQKRYFLVDESTLRSMQQHETVAAIQAGIADMEAGRVISLDDLDARIRARLRE